MPSAAQAILEDPTATGEGVLRAARSLLGDFYVWEPESIWQELTNQGAGGIPRVNCDKLLAAVTLWLVPSFYWDAVVFEKTALAFSGQETNPESLQEATPAEAAWAMEDAAAIRTLHGDAGMVPESEVVGYAAVILYRNAMTTAPKTLDFAQSRLDKINPSSTKVLREEVTAAWSDLFRRSKNIREETFEETPVGVQLARLAAIEVHMEDQRKKRASELQRLGV